MRTTYHELGPYPVCLVIPGGVGGIHQHTRECDDEYMATWRAHSERTSALAQAAWEAQLRGDSATERANRDAAFAANVAFSPRHRCEIA